ncbi:MAG: tail fiber domain-containing protein [Bacteroidia bacterium]|nr:tail fiber domain-containing protein [Bacteroidia bacterium]
MSLILCTIYAQSQDYIIHDNSLLIPDVPTPFLQTNPYPLGTTTPCKLEVGKSFNSMSYRAIFYGGNIGVSQSTSTFGNYLGKWSFTGAWQKKTLSGLPVQYTFIPGINYLVNYHRWGDYAAHFGLRATSTTRNDSYPEGISYTEAPQKDAVITWAYETGATPNRLIFQTIEGVDTTVPKPEDVEHEWATILSNGNIGSGTSNPTAQFQIKPLSTPGTPLFDILNGSNSSIFSFFEGSLGGVFNSVGQHSISSPLGVTSGTYKPFSVNNQNGVELFSVRDDANTALNTNLWINTPNSTGNPLMISKTIGGVISNLLQIANNGNITIHSLANLVPYGQALTLAVDHDGVIIPGTGTYIPWLSSGNSPSSSSIIFGTNNASDINLVAGGVNYGIIKGNSSQYEGHIELKKPIAIGGYPSGIYSGTFYPDRFATTTHTSTLTLEGLSPYMHSNRLNQRILICKNNQEVTFDVGYDALSFFNNRHYIMRDRVDLFIDPSTLNPYLSIYENLGEAHFVGTSIFDNDTKFNSLLPLNGGMGGTSSIGSSSDYWQYIYGQVGNISLSDIRLKENIVQLKFGLVDVLKMKSYSYNFKSGNEIHYGFIAQDLKKIFGNTIIHGVETDSTYIGVIYEELIPVLTNAIQEQQRMIDSLRFKLEIIYSSNSIKTELNPSSQKENINKQPILFQNSPNPFKGITFIDYFIPYNAENAFIKLVDKTGRIIKVFAINNLNFGQLELNCDELANGTYYYSLLVDGKLIDTKKMLILEKGDY